MTLPDAPTIAFDVPTIIPPGVFQKGTGFDS